MRTAKDKIVDELGDVLWYAARVSELINTTLGEVPVVPDIFRDDGRPTSMGLADAGLGLVVAAGEVAGHAKKALRDDEGIITDVLRCHFV
jgi:hypothetical protein